MRVRGNWKQLTRKNRLKNLTQIYSLIYYIGMQESLLGKRKIIVCNTTTDVP